MLCKMSYKIIMTSSTIRLRFHQHIIYNILQKHHISHCRPITAFRHRRFLPLSFFLLLFISLLYLDIDEAGRSSVSSCPIMANPDERYVPDPFVLSSPTALFHQNASRKRWHYSPAWLSNYSNTAMKPTLRARVCTRMRSEADPSRGIVFVTRWTGCSPLLDFVRSLISVYRHFGYL